MIRRALVLLALTTTSAWAAPQIPEATADEMAKVKEGEVVTRPHSEEGMSGVLGWVEIASDDETIWSILNDPELIKSSSGTITTCEKYRHDTEGPKQVIGLHYVLNVAWSEVTYYVVREFVPGERYLSWTLDESKESDLVKTEGFYAIQDGTSPGTVLLAYKSQADTGRNIPTWIQNMLTGKTLRGYLEFVKETAEGG